MDLYDLWAVSKTNDAIRFRVEYRLSAEGIMNAITRCRKIWLPEHYSLIRKPAQTKEQEMRELA
jgi:hypothetical protein